MKLVMFFVLNITAPLMADQKSFWLPMQPSLRFHNNEPIKLKPGSYQNLINAWQHRLDNSWKNFYDNLAIQVGLGQEQIEAYVQDPSLAAIYSSLKEADLLKLHEATDEEHSDPEVINFIKRTICKYCTKKNIKIILSPHINTITATFGSDQTCHYVICHAGIYTAESIKHFYECMANGNGAFYIESYTPGKIRFIELSNFLTIGLIEAASHIQHQTNLHTFLISNFKFCEKRPEQSTIQQYWHITEIRGILESIFQSKNPLETALFISKTKKRTEKEQKLWKQLIQDIADCYSPESLKFVKASIQEINELYLE